MADDFGLAIQAALVARLKAHAGVTGLVSARVYDEPPQNPTFPYVRIGGIEVAPLRADCARAATVTFSIEAHSRPVSGRVVSAQCLEAVVAALDGFALSVAGFTTVSLRWRVSNVTQNDDGQSYTGVSVFTAVLDG
jgi:hypothetical protein